MSQIVKMQPLEASGRYAGEFPNHLCCKSVHTVERCESNFGLDTYDY